jgi:hypothetical protein
MEKSCKVYISRMTKIPTIFYFAGKNSMIATKKAKQVEQLIEALACPISHLGVIKFWTSFFRTMEAYTLWWNGGFVKKFGEPTPGCQRL